jgi:hypothetical protein
MAVYDYIYFKFHAIMFHYFIDQFPVASYLILKATNFCEFSVALRHIRIMMQ